MRSAIVRWEAGRFNLFSGEGLSGRIKIDIRFIFYGTPDGTAESWRLYSPGVRLSRNRQKHGRKACYCMHLTTTAILDC